MENWLTIVRWVGALILIVPLTWLLSTLFWMDGSPIYLASLIVIPIMDVALLYVFSKKPRLAALKLAILVGALLTILLFALGLASENLMVGEKDISPLLSEFAIMLTELCLIFALQALLVARSKSN